MMAREPAAAERAAEIRDAARAWRAVGLVDDELVAAVEARYPDDRVRLPTGLRVLAFLLGGLAVLAVFGFVLLLGDGGTRASLAGIAGCFAVLCGAGTELQRGHWRRADAGAETATALLAWTFTAIALYAGNEAVAGDGAAPTLPLGLAALAAAAMAARWGTALLAVFAASLSFACLAQFGFGRLLWIGAVAVALGPLLAGSRHGGLAPSQRKGCWLAAAVALGALFAASNLVAWDQGWVEGLRTGPDESTWRAALRPIALAATGLLPLALLIAGAMRRELLLVLAGAAGIAIAAATVRYYRPLLPLAYALLLAGVALIATALTLRRWLRAGPGGERGGWTADPLFGEDTWTAAVKDAATAASLTPGPRLDLARPGALPGEAAQSVGGDGRFGGGGASGNF